MTRGWFDMVAQAALSSRETLQATYDLAIQLIEHDVPGDFVECGVFGGAQCAMMAQAIKDTRWGKRVHLFDSFNGVPAPTEYDTEWIEAGHPVGTSACPLDVVQERMREWGLRDESLVYHPGLFQDTVSEVDFKIALLRLDADLYESTKVCLEQLEPKVSPGGWIIIDDWELSGARKAAQEYWEKTLGVAVNPQDIGPLYWRKQSVLAV